MRTVQEEKSHEWTGHFTQFGSTVRRMGCFMNMLLCILIMVILPLGSDEYY